MHLVTSWLMSTHLGVFGVCMRFVGLLGTQAGFCQKNLLILVVLVVGRQIDFALLIDIREGTASTRGGGGWEAGPDGLIGRTVCGGPSTSLTLISM